MGKKRDTNKDLINQFLPVMSVQPCGNATPTLLSLGHFNLPFFKLANFETWVVGTFLEKVAELQNIPSMAGVQTILSSEYFKEKLYLILAN